MDIEDLFDEVHEHLDTTESKEAYIRRQCTIMHSFHWTTIPVIIQNYDNINFNIRQYNEIYLEAIKPSQRPAKLKLFTNEEIQLIVKWGIYLMQEYAKNNLQTIPDKKDFKIPLPNFTDVKFELSDDPIDEFTPSPTPPRLLTQEDEDDLKLSASEVHPPPTTQSDRDSESPNEYCFVMKNAKWNIGSQRNLQEIENFSTENLWIGDTGASCHFINSDKSMFNWKPIRHIIAIGDGTQKIATKEGSVRLLVHQRNGEKCIVTLHGCKYVEGMDTNYFRSPLLSHVDGS